jgi:hypothetical protein
MFKTSSLVRTLAVLPLVVLFVFAQNQYITIRDVSITPCPFKVEVTAAANLSYIDIMYSTKGTIPNSLASYGASKSSNQRRCYVSATISHPNLFARARPLRMEMSGSVKLDAGLTAKVETGLVWAAMNSMVSGSIHTCLAVRFSHILLSLTHAPPDKFHNCKVRRPNRLSLRP